MYSTLNYCTFIELLMQLAQKKEEVQKILIHPQVQYGR